MYGAYNYQPDWPNGQSGPFLKLHVSVNELYLKVTLPPTAFSESTFFAWVFVQNNSLSFDPMYFHNFFAIKCQTSVQTFSG